MLSNVYDSRYKCILVHVYIHAQIFNSYCLNITFRLIFPVDVVEGGQTKPEQKPVLHLKLNVAGLVVYKRNTCMGTLLCNVKNHN